MKNFKNSAKSTQDLALQLAIDLNFYGKRLASTKRAVVECIIEELALDDSIAVSSIMEFIEDNRPVKATKGEKAPLEPIVPTFKGQTQQRDESLTVLPCGRYIVSSAQNNTLAHASLAKLEQLADQCDATLLLMPIKYTTTLEQRERKEPTFLGDLDKYLVHENCFIGSRQGVRLAVTASILPTAKQPINTAKRLNTGEALTVVASPKAQIVTLPRPKGANHRWCYTTRTVTQRHYTDSRAGDEAEQDHAFGGLFLEVYDDGTIKHLELFADETTGEVFSGDNSNGLAVDAIVLGDLHCEKMCHNSLDRSLAQIERYQPKAVVLHDVLDFMSRNHHNRNSGRFLYQMGSRSVIDDLRETVAILNKIATVGSSHHSEGIEEVFIVFSNHDDALSQWLDCPHYNSDLDPINAKTYHFLKYSILEHIDLGHDDLNVFDLACRKLAEQVGELDERIVFGYLDEQKVINGFEVGQHGHHGSGGARGSARTFKNYQMPMITGHTHSPLRDGNLLTVGVTGSLEMGYNKGGSAWDRANAFLLSNGTAVLVPTYLINEPQS